MPTTPSRRRSPRRTAGAALAIVALAGAACSSGPTAQKQPAEAAASVRKVLDLTPEQTTCLQGRFEADPATAVALNNGLAEREAREAYVGAIRSCVPFDAFVALMTAALQDLFTGGDDAQAACLERTLRELTTTEQDLFYVYFSNPAAVDMLEVGPITKKITDTCRLDTTGGSVPALPGVTVTATGVGP